VDEAVKAHDVAALRRLLEVQGYNANLDSVVVLDATGELVVRLDAVRRTNPEVIDSFQYSTGGNYANWPIVAPILAGSVDQIGDKYAGLVDSPSGPLLYSSAPTTQPGGQGGPGVRTVGVLLVGTNVERLLARLKAESLSDLIVYTDPGIPIGSTLPNWKQEPQFSALKIEPDLYTSAVETPNNTPLRDVEIVTLFDREYRVVYAPMVIRGQTVGVIGSLLPSRFVLSALSTSRGLFVAIFSVGVALVVVGGILVAGRSIRPIVELVSLSRAVTQGDLSRRAQVQSADEIGILTRTFNEMTAQLESYTAQLEEDVARTNAILESTADGVLVRDPTGQIIMTNPAARQILTGEDGFDPMRLNAFSIPRDQSEIAARLDIGSRTISISMAKVNLPDSTYIGDVLVLRDVTSEAIAERTKENFLNQITHELRTPLTAIKGYSDILKIGFGRLPDEMKERAVDTIFRATNTLSQMIDQIVDLTAMQSGSMVLYSEPLNVHDLVSGALDEWKFNLSGYNLTAQFSSESPDLIVQADARRLRRVIDALLQNACDFSPAGGKLTVTLNRNHEDACLSITDPGVGIDEEDLPHIFERFYRGTPRDQEGNVIDVRGMGQGLYVVRSITEAHGGRVEAESSPGKGSTLRLYLPLLKDEEPE
jgi:signal transduction histidine kinase